MVIKMNQSYWQKTSKKTIEKKVTKDMTADIVIIGGGLTGVALAYQLKDSEYQVVVLDKDEMGSHTSGHTTAKITVLHSTLYQKIATHYDAHNAYLYYKSNQQAFDDIKKIIQKENIQCDYQENKSFIYTDDPKYALDIQQQKELFKEMRIPYLEDSSHLESLGLDHQAIFHPLKYLYGLIRTCQKSNVSFYEHSEVIHIERNNQGYILDVNGNKVRCQYLIHATRYPFIRKSLYFMKLFQEKEFVDFVTENKSQDSYLCIGHTQSYRPVSNHGSIQIDGTTKEWFAQDSTPLRGIPYIGRAYRDKNEFIIYGFQKWGMTLSQVSARLIADIILEKDNPYEEFYSCHYFNVSFAKTYASKIFRNTKKGMIMNRMQNHSLDLLERQDGIVTKINGKLTAVYKDKKGKLHYLSPYCPHLKCVVDFSKKDQTWTCPCHQSVYDAYGKLIEGPSLFSLRKKQ